MPIVVARHVFALPVDALWQKLGDFGDTGRWSGRPKEACVQDGQGIGCLRTLTIADGRVIIDRLEAVTDYSYSYSIVSGPLPYEHYRATMAVKPIDGATSEFTWTGEFEMTGMTDEAGIAFTRDIYAQGIAMMVRTLGVG